jgi:DNA anti-recombination protein RmuC
MRAQMARLQAANVEKERELAELASDYKGQLRQVEEQVDDLEERLEQAAAEIALVESRARSVDKSATNGDDVREFSSSTF